MHKIRGLIKPSTVILASCIVAAVLLLPASSRSIDWGCGGDCGEWVRTQAAQQSSAVCADGGEDFCREWCDNVGGQHVGTGLFCCTGPDGVCNAGDTTF